jgi:hypothetical protein
VTLIDKLTEKRLMVEYTLQNIQSPIGVASYTTKLNEVLPKVLESSLPTVEQIEAKLNK